MTTRIWLGTIVALFGASWASAQSIKITSPVAGKIYEQNEVLQVRWESSGFSGNVRIDLSTDGGNSWVNASPYNGFANSGAYDYRIYNDGTKQYQLRAPGSESIHVDDRDPGPKTRIRVRSESNADIYAISGDITIKDPSITLLSPLGGESYNLTSTLPVRWSTTGYNGDVFVAVSEDGGITWDELFNSWAPTANDGEYILRVAPDRYHSGMIAFFDESGSRDLSNNFAPGHKYRIRVRAGDSGSAAAFAISPADFSVSANPPPTDSNTQVTLVNLSARAVVPSGGAVIPGFVLANRTTVLIRAAGPALSAFGVSGTLPDPRIAVFSGSTEIASNDNWSTPVVSGSYSVSAAQMSAAFNKAGAFAFASGSLDAAVLLTLEPGAYSAAIRGAGNTSGEIIFEVYQVAD